MKKNLFAKLSTTYMFLISFFVLVSTEKLFADPPPVSPMLIEVNAQNTTAIPLFGTVNCIVDWGDGQTDTFVTSGNWTHTYTSANTYTISVSGTVSHYGSDNNTYDHTITKMLSWGNVGLTDLSKAFYNNTSLSIVPDSIPIAVTNLSYMFYGDYQFNFPIGSWNVSNVTDMRYMLGYNYSFNQPLNNWNVSNVTDMTNLFYGCYTFNQPLNNWNVSNVTDMTNLFYDCITFNQPLNNWNVSNVTDMTSLFFGCYTFNQPLNNWNVSNVTSMEEMFGWNFQFNQPLNNWDVSKVTNMHAMFAGTPFNQPLNNWNVSNVTNFSDMFVHAHNFNQDISSWDVSEANNMHDMFNNAWSFNQNLSNWCVQNIYSTPNNFNIFSSLIDNNYLPNWGAPCAGITCAQPSSLSATPTHNSVTLSWTKAAAANTTQMQIRVKGTNSWGGTSVSGTSYTFNYLLPNTTYEYRLRSLCANPVNSQFTSIGEFTTTAAPVVPVCQAPTGISATVNGNNSATINWTAANNGALYFVQVKPSTATWAQAGGSSTASTSRTFNYLQPATSYDYRIRTTCTPATTSNATSTFSAIGQFVTNGAPAMALFNTENTSWSIYPNPTTDIVNIEFNANEEAPMKLIVLDVAGRKVQEVATQSLIGNNQLQISLESLNKGLYFIQAIQGHEVKQVGKVTKQ